ncbi:MAG: hypothetical protein IJK42_05845 [Prevotella sp.]|nr:hypothetical protein [Prevotella sp.]
MVARERGCPSGLHIGGSSPTQSTFYYKAKMSSRWRDNFKLTVLAKTEDRNPVCHGKRPITVPAG